MKSFSEFLNEKNIKADVVDANHKHLGMKSINIDFSGNKIWSIDYNDVLYTPTGKTGTNVKTGKAVIELSSDSDERLWATPDGKQIWLD